MSVYLMTLNDCADYIYIYIYIDLLFPMTMKTVKVLINYALALLKYTTYG